MAALRHAESGRTSVLEAEHVVGRSPRSELRLDRPDVSARHALLRFNGKAWEVRDLGSRNGTFLDGAALPSGEDHPLQAGASLRFGHEQEEWTLVDDAPPVVMVVATDDGTSVEADGTILALPSADQPEVTLYRSSSGQWLIERPDEPAAPLSDHDLFDAACRTWRFCCPSVVARTQAVDDALELRNAELLFGVSPDEEHVELRVRCAGREFDLGSRSPHYLLLTLARSRLEETRRGLPDMLAGWVYQDDVVRGLGVDPSQLNIDVFRIRKQFAAAGFVDAAAVIERRASTKQLRVGVTRLRVESV